ncbi:MAG: hypothetical protein AAGE76_01760 [Pseudomonadota bacterium]
MFTIEHDFDASVVTLVDDAGDLRRKDITIRFHEDRVVVEQFDPDSGQVDRVTFSLGQVADLRAALDLPEGAYTRKDQD